MRKQTNDLEGVSNMIQNLDGMFAKSSSITRQATIGALMNTHMTGGNVRGHCLKMMGHISITEVRSSINVVEACLMENYNDKWILVSGATNHVCYSFKWFK